MDRLLKEADHRPWDAALRRRLAELCRKIDKHAEAQTWLQAAAACPSPDQPTPSDH
jgi:hypothetical protein